MIMKPTLKKKKFFENALKSSNIYGTLKEGEECKLDIHYKWGDEDKKY